MNKLGIVKGLVSAVAGMGAGTIVSSIIKDNVHRESTYRKIVVPVGAFFISGYVAAKASQQAVDEIDEVVKTITDFKNRNNDDSTSS